MRFFRQEFVVAGLALEQGRVECALRPVVGMQVKLRSSRLRRLPVHRIQEWIREWRCDAFQCAAAWNQHCSGALPATRQELSPTVSHESGKKRQRQKTSVDQALFIK